jgi:flagellar motility protein MotE (MotC chaperone)
MRWMRAMVIAGALGKLGVLGAWWWTTTARAERPAPESVAETAPAPAESQGLREVLEAVQQRGQELERREQALVEREAALRALEKTLAAELTRLEAGSALASAPVGNETLARIYENMRPEEAGSILDRLDDGTARAILGRMKERRIGPVLAAMSRERAVAVTKALAGLAGQIETR